MGKHKYWDKKKNAQVYEEVTSYLSHTPWDVVNKAVHTLVSKIEDRNNQIYIFGGLSDDTILRKSSQNKNEVSIIGNVTRRLVDFGCIDKISLLRLAMSVNSELLRLGVVYAMAQGKKYPDDIGLILEGDSLPDIICNSDCDYLIKICISFKQKKVPTTETFKRRITFAQIRLNCPSVFFSGTISKIVDEVTGEIIASDTVNIIVTHSDFMALQNRYDFTIASVLGVSICGITYIYLIICNVYTEYSCIHDDSILRKKRFPICDVASCYNKDNQSNTETISMRYRKYLSSALKSQ